MKLHKVEGRNSFCGPAAIAALTGVTTDEAAKHIRSCYGRRAVMRVYPEELVHALKAMGYEAEYCPEKDSPTLARWLREREDRNAPTIVFVTGHYAAVKGNKYVDNHTPEPVWISKAPGRRKRVKGVIRMTRGEVAA